MINNDIFINSISLKVLIALENEDLEPISLLYKLCVMDFKNQFSKTSVRNINAFSFYLKSYRKILVSLENHFLIKASEDKISSTFDGKKIVENLRGYEFVDAYLKTGVDVKDDKNDETYQSIYLSCLENYTKHFITKENL